MTKTNFSFKLILGLLVMFSCQTTSIEKKSNIEIKDPLPSWNDGSSKSSIINFVQSSTDSLSSTFVPVEDRIAVFDNDGTLWSEQPMYFQLAFALDQIAKLAPEHPEWYNTEPFKSVLNNDLIAVMKQGEGALLQIIMASHGGMTAGDFEGRVKEWMRTAKHPKFNRPYTDLVFQPMLEVLAYLRENEFKTFIVSGGGIGFMRPVTNQLYGIPAEQVVGSMMKVEYDQDEKIINRYPELSFIDDKSGKPVGIYNFIGKKPIAAFGNSDGDLQMLEWTSTKPNSFMMYVHHTDDKREWAYDSLSSIGKLKEGLRVAGKLGWTVADMKRDWKVVYPFELED
ncbi:MAG: HAD family hydrolase [Reichenbachiella sp.]|uniref:HAD family hydrolase n=1 Tax=Reichenbachiella sp. TaxID=2184521 RepID=UPI003297BE48